MPIFGKASGRTDQLAVYHRENDHSMAGPQGLPTESRGNTAPSAQQKQIASYCILGHAVIRVNRKPPESVPASALCPVRPTRGRCMLRNI